MINSMIAHEAKENPHSLHDEVDRLRRELMILTKTNRILLDRVETLNTQIELSERNRTWHG